MLPPMPGWSMSLRVDEAATAIAAQDGAVPTIYTGAIAETATATDSPMQAIAAADRGDDNRHDAGRAAVRVGYDVPESRR